jgi:hypothetical protein
MRRQSSISAQGLFHRTLPGIGTYILATCCSGDEDTATCRAVKLAVFGGWATREHRHACKMKPSWALPWRCTSLRRVPLTTRSWSCTPDSRAWSASSSTLSFRLPSPISHHHLSTTVLSRLVLFSRESYQTPIPGNSI